MLLRLAAQTAAFGTYDVDCQTGWVHLSQEFKILAGMAPGRPPLSLEELAALVYPDDRQAFLKCFELALDPSGSGDLQLECRLLRSDGSAIWVHTRGQTFFAGEGQERHPLSVTCIVADINARRLAERALNERQAELRELLDSVIDAIISIDPDQRIVLFNPAACRIFRCSAQEAIGSRLDRFIPSRYRGAHEKHLAHFAQEGSTGRTMGMPGVFSGLRADGEEFPVEASIAKVRVGGQWRLTVFLRDISERIKAEEAMRRSKEDLELAMRGAAIGVWNWDQRTGRVIWSDRCYQLFGLPADDAITFDRFMAIVHPADRDKVAAAIQQALQEGSEYNEEFRVLWPDGSAHWLAAIGRDLYDPVGDQAVGMRGVVLDIDERKRQESFLLDLNERLETAIEDRTAQLIRANEALERSNLELQQFAFIAAHDLQTPLRSISGFAQLLQQDYRGRFDSQADAWLDQLVRSVHRMRDVIQDILAYSRVESRGNAFRPTDFRQLFDDVVATLDAPIRETGAVVTREDLPTVMGDRTQLAQVLQNLIDNALKYHDGSDVPKIHVFARRQAGEWILSVRDNGIGIAEKHLEQIFDIFRRLHTQQEYPGTGIGLAVCRRVIHRHGGRIWVESQPGQGSVFSFSLPDRQWEDGA